jgi:hypothetical protein
MPVNEFLEIASILAKRLRLFQKTAMQAKETESRIDMDPAELWEPEGQAALDKFDEAINRHNGLQPLFSEEEIEGLVEK